MRTAGARRRAARPAAGQTVSEDALSQPVSDDALSQSVSEDAWSQPVSYDASSQSVSEVALSQPVLGDALSQFLPNALFIHLEMNEMGIRCWGGQSQFSSSSATLAEMRLNRTLIERSIKLSVYSYPAAVAAN